MEDGGLSGCFDNVWLRNVHKRKQRYNFIRQKKNKRKSERKEQKKENQEREEKEERERDLEFFH